MLNNREAFYVRKNLFRWLMQRGSHKRHGIRNESGARNSRKRKRLRRRKDIPRWCRKSCNSPSHKLARAKKREEGDATCKGDGDRFYRLDIMFTTRNAPATPCRQTGPDVSCWELVRFTSGDKNRLPGLAFSFNWGVKRSARSRLRY